MTNQTAQDVAVFFKTEGANFGTLPGTDGAYGLRLNAGAGLAASIAIIRSGEIRSDGMETQGRHGGRSVAGNYSGDLSVQSFDKLIEATMRGTLTQGTAFGTVGTISSTAATKTFTYGGTLSAIVDGGFRVGDLFQPSGWTGSGTLMNGTNFTIASITASTITVLETVVDMATASQVVTFKRSGQKVTNGTAKRSFTFEEENLDTDTSEIFTGCRVTKLSIKGTPNQPTVITFDIAGQDEQTKAGTLSPYFSSGGTNFTSQALVVEDAIVYVNGTADATLTGFDLTIEPGGVGQPVVGGTVTPDIFQGITKVSGSITGLRSDLSRLNHYLAEDTLSLSFQLAAHGGLGSGFHSIYIPNVKFNGNSKQFAQQGPMIETVPFMAGRDDTGTATGHDVSICAWQISNTSS